MSDVDTWEQRMADKARVRREAVEAEQRAEHAEWRAKEVARQQALAGVVGSDRWREHHHAKWRHVPTLDGEERWPDHTACLRCYEHDTAGRVHETASLNHWSDGIWWWPVRTCTFKWDFHSPEIRTGCDCFCHQVGESPPAIA